MTVGVSDVRIQDLLDADEAKVSTGIYVAPILKGEWGTTAQLQIEPRTTYGPHQCMAGSLVSKCVRKITVHRTIKVRNTFAIIEVIVMPVFHR